MSVSQAVAPPQLTRPAPPQLTRPAPPQLTPAPRPPHYRGPPCWLGRHPPSRPERTGGAGSGGGDLADDGLLLRCPHLPHGAAWGRLVRPAGLGLVLPRGAAAGRAEHAAGAQRLDGSLRRHRLPLRRGRGGGDGGGGGSSVKRSTCTQSFGHLPRSVCIEAMDQYPAHRFDAAAAHPSSSSLATASGAAVAWSVSSAVAWSVSSS
jgi:hypothetical protein